MQDSPETNLKMLSEVSHVPPGALLVDTSARRWEILAAMTRSCGMPRQGMIHISELSWDVVMTPESVVQQGTPVRCAVLDVNVPKARISLSLKRMQVRTASVRDASPPWHYRAARRTSVQLCHTWPSSRDASARWSPTS